jgi:hypothetical protein
MLGANDLDLGLGLDYIPVPASEVTMTPEPPAKKARKDLITSKHLSGMIVEDLLHYVARRSADFQGEALVELMKMCGITGVGGSAAKKLVKINEVLSRCNISYEGSVINVTVMEELMADKLVSELAPWVVEHAKAFESTVKDISEPAELLQLNLEKLRKEFHACFGEDLVKYYTITSITFVATSNPMLVAALRTYTLKQMCKGERRPAVVVQKEQLKKSEPKPKGTNHYLLSTVITWSTERKSNALRLLGILNKARTQEIRAEISLFTNGWSAGIGNAVRAAVLSLSLSPSLPLSLSPSLPLSLSLSLSLSLFASLCWSVHGVDVSTFCLMARHGTYAPLSLTPYLCALHHRALASTLASSALPRRSTRSTSTARTISIASPPS